MVTREAGFKPGMFRKPKKLGEVVRVIDPTSKYYDRLGHKQACRPTGEVLLFILETKNHGWLVEQNWDQCSRQ
jgi:hypothetical protein